MPTITTMFIGTNAENLKGRNIFSFVSGWIAASLTKTSYLMVDGNEILFLASQSFSACSGVTPGRPFSLYSLSRFNDSSSFFSDTNSVLVRVNSFAFICPTSYLSHQRSVVSDPKRCFDRIVVHLEKRLFWIYQIIIKTC